MSEGAHKIFVGGLPQDHKSSIQKCKKLCHPSKYLNQVTQQNISTFHASFFECRHAFVSLPVQDCPQESLSEYFGKFGHFGHEW